MSDGLSFYANDSQSERKTVLGMPGVRQVAASSRSRTMISDYRVWWDNKRRCWMLEIDGKIRPAYPEEANLIDAAHLERATDVLRKV
jgi:hypothetical protein